MCQASWNGKAETTARSVVLGRRAFLVPSSKCQARVLECQALDLGNGLRTMGWGLGGLICWLSRFLAHSPQPIAPSQVRKGR